MAMSKTAFNALVDNLAKAAVSCDFNLSDADSAIWDGIRDAGYTWQGESVSDAEYLEAVSAARPLVEELEAFYNSIVRKHMRE